MKEANISVPVTENLVIHLVSLNSKITSEPRANPLLVMFRFLRFKRNSKQEGKKIRKKTAKY